MIKKFMENLIAKTTKLTDIPDKVQEIIYEYVKERAFFPSSWRLHQGKAGQVRRRSVTCRMSGRGSCSLHPDGLPTLQAEKHPCSD